MVRAASGLVYGGGVGQPVLIEPGGGEAIVDTDTRRVAILGDLEQMVVTESRYGAGETGPGPHVHHRHVDAFYVLEGSLVFAVGPHAATEVLAAPGTLALVPPEVVHTFWSPGPRDASFLNIHAPGSGFGEHLRAARDDRAPAVDFDTDDPPADGGLPASHAVVRGPGEGETLAVGPAHALLKAQSADGGGRFSLAETTLPPGLAGPPPHRHERLADSFYVLEGTLALRLEGETREAPPGSFAWVPPGTVHTFANEGEEPIRALNLMAPAGFERYLKEVVRLSADGPPDPAELVRIAPQHDLHPAAGS
jgi:mannose-6-phosphate isomerase-like protein (cupin superfamily)